MIQQGNYDLTETAMRLRCQSPIHAGDDYTLQFTLNDSDGNAVDITGYTIEFCVKQKLTDSVKLLDKTATLITPASGRFDVVLLDTDSSNTEKVFGVYEIQATDGSGLISTLLHGCIEILPQIC